MKIDILDGEHGTLLCRKGFKGFEEFKFKVDSLRNWYPLNINYVYKYSLDNGELYVTLADTYSFYYDYGIYYKKQRATQPTGRFNPKRAWYVEEVAQDNDKVAEYADSLGVTSFNTEAYTNKDITNSFGIVLEEEQKLIAKSEAYADNYVDTLNFDRLTKEEKDKLLFEFMSEEDMAQYRLLGKVRVMLNLLRKVYDAKVEEINNDSE